MYSTSLSSFSFYLLIFYILLFLFVFVAFVGFSIKSAEVHATAPASEDVCQIRVHRR